MKTTTGTGRAAPAIGWAYVLGDLKENDSLPRSRTKRPPAIGLLVRALGDDRFEVRLRMGPHRWAPKGRIVVGEQFRRLATAREVATGYILSDSQLLVAA